MMKYTAKDANVVPDLDAKLPQEYVLYLFFYALSFDWL